MVFARYDERIYRKWRAADRLLVYAKLINLLHRVSSGMNLFTKMKRQRIERRFKRKDLSIIQGIPTDLFHKIVHQLAERGWEVSIDYQGESGWQQKGKCKVRKGTSVLDFEWSVMALGSITGLDRIVTGIASEFELTKQRTPKW